MRVFVFNGWAAGPDTWELCRFPHDWVFDYIEQLDGVPEKVLAEADEFVLVGFSMGGSTALRMLLKFPEKVRGMVLVSTTACMSEHKDEGWRGMSDRRREALYYGTKIIFRDDPSPIYATDSMVRGLDYLRDTDLRRPLEDFVRTTPLSFPTALFQSERDGIVRPENAAYLKGIFPNAAVTMVAGAEHVLPITVPALIDRAVFDIIGNDET